MDKDDEKDKSSRIELEKEELMNELAKEIEELENEVDSQPEESRDADKIDWGESAITSIINDKEKIEKRTEKQKKLEEKRKILEEKKAEHPASAPVRRGETRVTTRRRKTAILIVIRRSSNG